MQYWNMKYNENMKKLEERERNERRREMTGNVINEEKNERKYENSEIAKRRKAVLKK